MVLEMVFKSDRKCNGECNGWLFKNTYIIVFKLNIHSKKLIMYILYQLSIDLDQTPPLKGGLR